MAVGQLSHARDGFVDGLVDLEVLPLQIGAALPAVVEPDEEDPAVVRRAFADQEGVARNAAGLVNQGRGGRPAGIVEHGVVRRRQDALERARAALVPQTTRVMRWHSSRTSRAEVRITPAGATPTVNDGHDCRVRASSNSVSGRGALLHALCSLPPGPRPQLRHRRAQASVLNTFSHSQNWQFTKK